MPQILITISPTGETHLETRGYSGPACLQATRTLEAALGLRQSDALTAEFFERPTDAAVTEHDHTRSS
jgi:hypothetical protein